MQTLDNAVPTVEDEVKTQAFKQQRKDIVFMLASLTAFASADPHLSFAPGSSLVLAASRNSTRKGTIFPGFQVHL